MAMRNIFILETNYNKDYFYLENTKAQTFIRENNDYLFTRTDTYTIDSMIDWAKFYWPQAHELRPGLPLTCGHACAWTCLRMRKETNIHRNMNTSIYNAPSWYTFICPDVTERVQGLDYSSFRRYRMCLKLKIHFLTFIKLTTNVTRGNIAFHFLRILSIIVLLPVSWYKERLSGTYWDFRAPTVERWLTRSSREVLSWVPRSCKLVPVNRENRDACQVN